MNWPALTIRILLAFFGSLAASRTAGAGWEPALFAATLAARTTAEAFTRSPQRRGRRKPAPGGGPGV